jgi:hypothetical protein
MAIDPTTATVIVAALGIGGTATGSIISARAAAVTAREETERVREGYREAERQNRQGTYHRFLAVLNRMDSFAIGYPPTGDEYEVVLAEFNVLHAGLLLFGAPQVKEAIAPVVVLLDRVGAGMDAREKVPSFIRSYQPLRQQILEAQGALIAAMAADTNSGIFQ